MDENQLHNDVLRAEKARELLDNQLLKEALNTIESEVVKMWGEAPQRDKDGKEALWQLYQTAMKFRSILTSYINIGEFSRHKLDKFEKDSKLRSLFRRS